MILWLWCSAQGSLLGKVKFIKECLDNEEIFSQHLKKIKKFLKEIHKIPDRNLSTCERQAIYEAELISNKLKKGLFVRAAL